MTKMIRSLIQFGVESVDISNSTKGCSHDQPALPLLSDPVYGGPGGNAYRAHHHGRKEPQPSRCALSALSPRQFHFAPADGIVLPELARGCQTGSVHAGSRACFGICFPENGTSFQVREKRGDQNCRFQDQNSLRGRQGFCSTEARFQACRCQENHACFQIYFRYCAKETRDQAGFQNKEEVIVIRQVLNFDPQACFNACGIFYANGQTMDGTL